MATFQRRRWVPGWFSIRAVSRADEAVDEREVVVADAGAVLLDEERRARSSPRAEAVDDGGKPGFSKPVLGKSGHRTGSRRCAGRRRLTIYRTSQFATSPDGRAAAPPQAETATLAQHLPVHGYFTFLTCSHVTKMPPVTGRRGRSAWIGGEDARFQRAAVDPDASNRRALYAEFRTREGQVPEMDGASRRGRGRRRAERIRTCRWWTRSGEREAKRIDA